MCRCWPTRSRRSRYAGPLCYILAPLCAQCFAQTFPRSHGLLAADVCLFWPCYASMYVQQEIEQVAKAMVDLEARRRNLGPQRDHINDTMQQAK